MKMIQSNSHHEINNVGKKSQSYALNAIAQKELGLIKYEYKAEGLTLDQLYEQDPLNFALQMYRG